MTSKPSFHTQFRLGVTYFWKRLAAMVIDPTFLILTVVGNAFVVCAGFAMYFLEKEHNPTIQSWLDGIWWAVSTVTTVGYGDVTPVTTAGRVLGIVMMLAGTAIFISFTALFSRAIIGFEIIEVEKEIKKLERDIESLKKEK